MSKHKSRPVSIPTAKPTAVDPLDMTCARCTHWDGTFCRRYPPTVFRTPGGTPIAHWPPVDHNDGCGEWSANG